MTETYRYDAFGTLISIQHLNEAGVLAEVETALSRFLYAGEQLDTTTGLYYLRARQYDTVLGRFTQEDTYLGDGRNLYVYVSNNPLKYVDPSGYCSKNLGCAASTSKETTQSVWMNALNAGFTAPDSYSGYLGQQWGTIIAPTVQKDPAGSAYAFKEGFLDSVVPFRSSDDYFYTDMYLTGQMMGMIVTGGVSEYVAGINTIKNIQMFKYLPSYSIAGGGSYSVALAGAVDVTWVAEGFAGAYFWYSTGTTAGNAVSSVNLSTESGRKTSNTLTDAQKSRLNSLDNTINDHLTESDFSGTLRDLQGNPVPNGKGGYFDHAGEMRDSYRSLQKIKEGLEGSLKNPNLSDTDRTLLQEGLDKANSYIKRIEELFNPYGGIN